MRVVIAADKTLVVGRHNGFEPQFHRGFGRAGKERELPFGRMVGQEADVGGEGPDRGQQFLVFGEGIDRIAGDVEPYGAAVDHVAKVGHVGRGDVVVGQPLRRFGPDRVYGEIADGR